jgi:hypothetical protein
MRIFLSVFLGLLGFSVYVWAAIALGDRVQPLNWAIQGLYFLIAGVLWVVPAHYLILWTARK